MAHAKPDCLLFFLFLGLFFFFLAAKHVAVIVVPQVDRGWTNANEQADTRKSMRKTSSVLPLVLLLPNVMTVLAVGWSETNK